MIGKSAFLALVLAVSLAAPATSQAPGAGVGSPGSAGGLSNSIDDPSGVTNPPKIPPPPPPNITVPTVPQAAPMVSTRVAPATTSRGSITRRAATMSRSETRRAVRAEGRARSKDVNPKFNICRGC